MKNKRDPAYMWTVTEVRELMRAAYLAGWEVGRTFRVDLTNEENHQSKNQAAESYLNLTMRED